MKRGFLMEVNNFLFQNVDKYPAAVLQQFLQSAKAMLQIDLPAKTPLTAILKTFVQKYDRKDVEMTDITNGKKCSVKPDSRVSRDIVQSVTSALLTKSPSASLNTGQLIDKLVSMEPELIGSCRKLQVSTYLNIFLINFPVTL